MWRKKRKPDEDLEKLRAALKVAGGDYLKSVIVFGSMASGEFHDEHSDVNVLVVLEPLTLPVLARLQKAFQPWIRAGHLLPLLATSTELPLLARTHPIEFLDMRDHHRILYGENVLSALVVDKANLRAQIEHDLSQVALRLRQQIAASGEKPDALKKLLVDSAPSVMTLLRATLRLQEDVPRLSKMEAAERLAPRVGIDPLLLRRLANFRFERKSDDLKGLMTVYFEVIEKLRQFLAAS